MRSAAGDIFIYNNIPYVNRAFGRRNFLNISDGVSKIIVVNFDNDDEKFKLTFKGVPHGATVTVSKLFADKMLVKESVYTNYTAKEPEFDLKKQGVAIIDVN